MILSDVSIRRPVFTAMVSLLLIVLGLTILFFATLERRR